MSGSGINSGISLAGTPDGKFLMAGNAGSNNVTVFSIAANGALTQVAGSPFAAGGPPDGMKISPNGEFLASGLWPLGPVAVLSIAGDGTLSPVSGSPFQGSGGDAGVDIKCSGNQLFAGNVANLTRVDVFSIAANGTLSPIPGSPFQPGVGVNSNGVLLSPHKQFLFVSNQGSGNGDDTITVFKVAANGFLTLVPGSPFPVNSSGSYPTLMATNQAGTFLFTANFPGNTGTASIGVFSVASDGSLTEVGKPVPVQGSFLEAIAAFPAATCTNPVPLISQPLVPDAVPAGGAQFTLTVNGTGFVSNSVVNWNGAALSTTVVNDKQIMATVPASNIAVAGTASVTVTSPAPGGGTSNVAFFAITSPTASVSFASLPPLTVGVAPIDAVVGDFNQDGKQDLAIVNFCGTDPSCSGQSAGTVSILLGNGDGTFSVKSTVTVGLLPTTAAIGDFNRDGKLDLAVVNYCVNSCLEGSTVSILLGNGDGTFAAGNDVSVASTPWTVITADFNGDGNLDLATANLSGSVSISLGNGDGTFRQFSSLPVGGSPVSLVAGDFNGDGILDLAVDSNNGTVTIFLGNGDGTFSQFAQLMVGANTFSEIVTGDFNRDGKLDLAVSNLADNTISVLLGNGDGTFQNQVTYPTGAGPLTMSIGDLNGDNIPDLAVFNGDGTVTVFLGKGDGTFQATLGANNLGAPWGTVGDFNGDGRLDLAVANEAANTVSILLQSPIASLAPPTLSFGDQTLNTKSPPQTVTLSNAGSASLVIAGISITGLNSSDFAQTNDCGNGLLAGANCQINVTFTPSAVGARSATLSVSDNASGSPQTASLSGLGVQMVGVILTPASLDFGDQMVGTPSSPLPVTLQNNQSVSLTISSITTSGDYSQTNNCGGSVPANGSCTINVVFTPSTAGVRNGTLTVTDNGPGSPQTASLTGTGISSQGTAPSCTLAVQGGGSSSLTISATANCTDSNGTISNVTIDWGDNTPPTSGNTGTLVGTHTYAAAGTYTITVTATNNFGQQGGVSQNVTFPPPPPPVFAGQSTQTTQPVTAPGNTTPTVTFMCTQASGPSGSVTGSAIQGTYGLACSFSPASATLSSTPVTLTITIQTTGGTTALLRPTANPWLWAAVTFGMPLPAMVLLGLGCLGGSIKRNVGVCYVTLGLITILLLLLPSCGGGFLPPAGPPPSLKATPAGSYTVTVGAIDNTTGFVQTSLIVPLTVTSK
jgi:6-phosphogluconolactonase (cycloisomerase 2 family)